MSIQNFKNNAVGVVKAGFLAGMTFLAASCGKPGVDPEPGPSPGTDPGKVTSYNITGKASISFDMADSSFVFWQKVYGASPSEDKLVQAKISASSKAKGDLVTFENDLIKQDNINRFSNGLVYLKDYNRRTAVFAEGKNIGKTADGKNVIKDMRFDGIDLQILVKNADNASDIMNIVNNQNLKWKLEGDKATGYGGADKVYALKVN